jgi:hypothetical protein
MSSTLAVEFCGLPGAGKSWLAPRVAGQLRRSGIPARLVSGTTSPRPRAAARAVAKVRLATSQLLREPVLAPIVIAAAARDPQRRARDRVPRLVHWLAAQEEMRRSTSTHGVSLLDEGPIQALWSIGLWGDHRPLLERLERWNHPLRLPDVLVVVRAHPDTADHRLTHRGAPHSRMERVTSHAERREHLRRGAILLDELVSHWERQTSRTAVEVDGHGQDPASSDGQGSRCAPVVEAITALSPANRGYLVPSASAAPTRAARDDGGHP